MNVKTLTATILGKMSGITKWQSVFLTGIFDLHLRIASRHNFKNMSRYGEWNEKTYHQNYARSFDFGKFNILLCQEFCSDLQIVAFDPSYISKSGKQTPGTGYFWSGCAGKTKWGIEIAGFASVDIINNTGMHLLAKQTLANEEERKNLLDYYAKVVIDQKEMVTQISKYLAVDAYFSREPFVSQVHKAGIELITRLRHDAHLIYPYVGPHPKRRGAKTKYAGKVDPRNLDLSYFTCCIKEEDFCVYQASLYSKALKRMIRVALVHNYDEQGNIKSHQIYASTDLTLQGEQIYYYYKARFQIEFLYRDAKQFVGLEHCQSRDENKLDFHFNTTLTTVSIAKALYHLNQPIETRKPFSMSDVKTQHINEQMFDLIIQECGISPNSTKIRAAKKRVLNFGKIAA